LLATLSDAIWVEKWDFKMRVDDMTGNGPARCCLTTSMDAIWLEERGVKVRLEDVQGNICQAI